MPNTLVDEVIAGLPTGHDAMIAALLKLPAGLRKMVARKLNIELPLSAPPPPKPEKAPRRNKSKAVPPRPAGRPRRVRDMIGGAAQAAVRPRDARGRALRPNGETRAAPRRAILDEVGIASICQMIANGKHIVEVAKELDVALGLLYVWMGEDPARQAAIREARAFAASVADYQAEQVLLDARHKDAVPRARELAHHYRWRAAVFNPSAYGPKVDVSTNVSLDSMTDAQLEQRLKSVRAEIAGIGAATGAAPTAQDE